MERGRREFVRDSAVLLGASCLTGLEPLLAAPAASSWTIGCMNRPWTKWTFGETLAAVKAAGYSTIGLLTRTKTEPFIAAEATPEYLEGLKRQLAGSGLAANMGALRSRYDVPLEETLKSLRKEIDNAAFLGLRYVLTFGVDDPLQLDRYFQAFEKTTPDFVARAWLGERYAGSHAFRGRSTERKHVEIPMSMLAETKDTSELLIAKEGKGRLYYRLGLRYAPDDLLLEPLDRGFTVERAYEGVDAADDVRRDADGTWRIRAGSRVRVRLTLVAPARRYHVALVDPLPAGLEPLNPALKTTGDLPDAGGSEVTPLAAPGLGGPGLPGHWWRWSRTWFEHQNLRDERVEAFTSLLWEGVYSYRYVARATTPGSFVVAPPRAEEMYAPETFGRGASVRVIVE